MRRMDQYSESVSKDRGRSSSPTGLRDWKSLTGGPDGAKSDRDKSRGAASNRGNSEQDAQILKSLWGDDVKIRQGQALMKPSEIRNRTPGRKRAKDWGECPLTFDKIKEPVRAGDGKVYEKWAIKKWLEENNNRSPLTNTNIGPVLTPLTDEDEGQVFGERTENTGGQDTGSKKNEIKTEINTVLNAVRGVIPVDEAQYTEVPVAPDRRSSTGSSALQPQQPTKAPTGSSQGESGGKTPNQLIADVMRDNSLTMQQKNDRIQAIRSGKPATGAAVAAAPDEAPQQQRSVAAAPRPVAPAAASASSEPDATTVASSSQDGAGDSQKRIAEIMRDMSLTPQQKNALIQDVRSGKASAGQERGVSQPAASQPAAAARPVPPTKAASQPAVAESAPSEAPAGGIDWTTVQVPEPVRRQSSSSGVGSAPGYQLQSPVHGDSSHLPPPATPEEPRHPAQAAPVAFNQSAPTAMADKERSQSRGRFRNVLPSWMGGGGGSKAKENAAREPPTSPRMVTKSQSMASMGVTPANPPLERRQTFSEGAKPAAEIEFGEVARAWGIFFAQYPKNDPVHGGALFVFRLKDGGAADESEQVMIGDILYEVDGVVLYKRSLERVQKSLHGSSSSGKSAADLLFKRPIRRIKGTPLTPDALEDLESVQVKLQKAAGAASEGIAGTNLTVSKVDVRQVELEGTIEELRNRLKERDNEVVRMQQQQQQFQAASQQQQQQQIEKLQQQLSQQIALTQQQLEQQSELEKTSRGGLEAELQRSFAKIQQQLLETQRQLQESQQQQLEMQKELQRVPDGEIERLNREIKRLNNEARQQANKPPPAPEKLQLHATPAPRAVRMGIHPELCSGLEIQADKAPFTHFGQDCWAFRDLMRDRDGLDLSMICSLDGKVVKAHRAVMCAACPGLRHALRGGSVAGIGAYGMVGAEMHVQMTDVGGAVLQAMINFVYEGKLRVEGSHELFELHRIGRTLQVAGLGEACEDGLLANLSAETCAELLSWCLEEGIDRVMSACREMALTEFKAVCRSDAFCMLPEVEIGQLLQSEHVNVQSEEELYEGVLPWIRSTLNGPGPKGDRLLSKIRFSTMPASYVEGILAGPDARLSSKLRTQCEQALVVLQSGSKAQLRPSVEAAKAARAAASAPPPRTTKNSNQAPGSHASAAAHAAALPVASEASSPTFRFDKDKSHAIVSIKEGGLVAEIREDGESEHSAILSPPLPRTGRHYIEFQLLHTGTPECYLQIGVCRGTHDIKGGTPAYQSDSGWCFSCHNGNLLHFDAGSKYSRRLPRTGDLVGLQVDMDMRSLEMFINGEGQGVMVDGLPGTLYFVVDGGDQGQCVRITDAKKPGSRR